MLTTENLLAGNGISITASGSSSDIQANIIRYSGSAVNASGSSTNLAANAISESTFGITSSGSSANIVENELVNTETGIISSGSSTNIQVNNITGSRTGIITTGKHAAVINNMITGSDTAMVVSHFPPETARDYNIISGSSSADVVSSGNDRFEAYQPPSFTSLVLSDIMLEEGAEPGKNATLEVTLHDNSSNPLPGGTRITLAPGNLQAHGLGDEDGILSHHTVTIRPEISIPGQPGRYEYVIYPVQTVVTGEKIPLRKVAGPLIPFILDVDNGVVLSRVD